MLKFLVDESTGVGISEKLKQMGFDSMSVIEIMKGSKKRKWQRYPKHQTSSK